MWSRLRAALLKEHGLVCTACGYAAPTARDLEGHEVWSYPGNGVIRLEAIQLLCKKCHHAVHLQRSVGWARDIARRELEAEHPAPELPEERYSKRGAWLGMYSASGERLTIEEVEQHYAARSAAQTAIWDAADKAGEEYREEMLRHYCKVNCVTRKQCDRDWERAQPPEDIMRLAPRGKPRVPAQMDYGPFKDELAKTVARRTLRVEQGRPDPYAAARRAQKAMKDHPGEWEVWQSLTSYDRAYYDNDFEVFLEHQGEEDDALYEWPYMSNDELAAEFG